jgi:5'-3' exonuclease
MSLNMPWILVDLSYLAHRARFASGDLEYDDFYTGVMFGFWEQVRTLCREVQSNNFQFFFDSRKSFRRKAYPEYKATRSANLSDEERRQMKIMREQIQFLRRDVLPNIGFSVYHQTGCESDDLMAQAALQLSERNESSIIVTADGDLWQCISQTVTWYDPGKKRWITPPRFLKEKGISCNQWGQVKAIAGCSGDNVKGIAGVGEKKAIQYLTGQMPDHHKAFKNIQNDERDKHSIIARNQELVVLPHKKTKPLKIHVSQGDSGRFFTMCERYGFLSYLREPRQKEWAQFFNGQFHQSEIKKPTRKRYNKQKGLINNGR